VTNTLVFVDFPTPDIEQTTRFYEDLFGWQIEGRPQGDFHRIVPGEGLHMGLYAEHTQTPDPNPSPKDPRQGLQPRTYILVDDNPQTYLDKAVKLGATKLWDENYWGEFDGRHASFLDPWGNQIVMWYHPPTEESS
jgi:predicted enzyme related to lactoylglutathione lyase